MYVNDVQAKIVILYTLKKMKLAICMDQLFSAVIDNDILDYFSLMHYFYDLLDYGYIEQTTIENEVRYDIMPKGLEAVDLFADKIPARVKRKLDKYINDILGTYKKPMEIKTATTALSETQFIAKCGIYEWNDPLLEINITVGDRWQAEKIADHFKENATEIYQKTFGILGVEIR